MDFLEGNRPQTLGYVLPGSSSNWRSIIDHLWCQLDGDPQGVPKVRTHRLKRWLACPWIPREDSMAARSYKIPFTWHAMSLYSWNRMPGPLISFPNHKLLSGISIFSIIFSLIIWTW